MLRAISGFAPRSFYVSEKEVLKTCNLTRMDKYVTRSRLRDDERKAEVEEQKRKFLTMKLVDKRKLYKCKEKFIKLEDLPVWPEYFEEHLKEDEQSLCWWKRNKHRVTKKVSEELNTKMSIFTGDITSLEIDAIANAANESLLGGGGVDGAIHAAAGPLLRSECELLNGCSAGNAKISLGYKLPAKYVLHTVGPRGEKPDVLRSCYKNSLKLLKENKLRSVAFPCISTGIFGYPNEKAAKVALETIREFLETDEYGKDVDRVIMCLFLKKDVEIYREQMQMFFPVDHSDKQETPQDTERKPVESDENPQDRGRRPVESDENLLDMQESPQNKQESPQESENDPQDIQGSPKNAQEGPQESENDPQDMQESPQNTQVSPQESKKDSQNMQGRAQNTQERPQESENDPHKPDDQEGTDESKPADK
ncbi:ADP-ribose glycohydrolase MACROD2 [Aplysia californica]|uniref:ADP-ribose glycohydrolase MACROD2 n=1 Tax=Aplysia californica TaxID=6500 RepID=A0ABM0K0P2_APLCA|nr:ADP-ribose glycohydrolase MACROD2 [Aplysia californica]